uniref:MAGE domain-containing protein n=1 Tax=Monodon monoceros TaxID=40151 RepID=A0A8C6BLZ3_MONMO
MVAAWSPSLPPNETQGGAGTGASRWPSGQEELQAALAVQGGPRVRTKGVTHPEEKGQERIWPVPLLSTLKLPRKACEAEPARNFLPSCQPLDSQERPEPQGAPATTSRDEGVSCPGSEEGAQSQDEKSAGTSQAAPSTHSSCRDPLSRKSTMFVEFLLEKYITKEPILQEDMLKIVNQKYQDRFAEILKKASERIEAVFAVDLKEVDSTIHSYDLVSKLKLPNNGRVRAGRGLPKTSLLMTVLGVIFMNGNCATEEDIWKFLNMMQVYAGRKHFIYREPRKLITKDLVRLKYLEYRQVLNSDPPRYEFLWGPKAHTETSKMKILEFLAKVSDMVPSAFSSRYEEAFQDEEERDRAKIAARPGNTSHSEVLGFTPST